MVGQQINDSNSQTIKTAHSIRAKAAHISSQFSAPLHFASVLFINSIRFTTSAYSKEKLYDDSSILFIHDSEIRFGRISHIFTVDGGSVHLEVHTLSMSSPLTYGDTAQPFTLPNIQSSTIKLSERKVIIQPDQVIEKCACFVESLDKTTFIRFPNLEESS